MNKYFINWNEDQLKTIKQVQALGGEAKVDEILGKVAKQKILVVGEPIVDQAQELRDVDRLGEIRHRARREQPLPLRCGGVGAEDGDRQRARARVRPEPPQDFLAGQVWQVQVER